MKCEIREYYYDHKSGKHRYDTGDFFEESDELSYKGMKCLDNLALERHENAKCIYYDRPDIYGNRFTRYIFYK